MSLAERRWLRLFTLCALYVAQGIPWGFTSTTLPNYLTSRGLDETLVNTTLAFTVLPYTFKWMWGPIIDAFTLPRFGRRRPWIVFAEAMMALTIFAMVLVDVEVDLTLLAWMVLIHTVFNALQDVSVDALGVDLLDEAERGRANGFMYASKYVGGFIGGAVMTEVVVHVSFRAALLVQVAVLLAIMCLPLLLRERSGEPPPRPRLGEIARSMLDAFSVRSAVVLAFVCLAIYFALGILTAISRTLYIQYLGWEYDDLTVLTGGWGLLVGGAGASIGGLLADRFGKRRVALIASVALALGWLVFANATSAWHDPMFVYVLAFWETLSTAVMTVALFAVCMDQTLPRIAGSQFAAYMALLNFSTTLGYQAAVPVEKLFGGAQAVADGTMAISTFSSIYVVAAIVQVCVTAALLAVDPGETRRVLPRPPGTRPSPIGIVALAGVLAVLLYFTMRTIL